PPCAGPLSPRSGSVPSLPAAALLLRSGCGWPPIGPAVALPPQRDDGPRLQPAGVVVARRAPARPLRPADEPRLQPVDDPLPQPLEELPVLPADALLLRLDADGRRFPRCA